MGKRLTVKTHLLSNGTTITVQGRNAWALLELVNAGSRGCTPIDNPGPRWSGYVFNLKHNCGLKIETRREPHHGAFPGTHARYVLHTPIEIVTDGNEPTELAVAA